MFFFNTYCQERDCNVLLKGKISDIHSGKTLDFAAIHILENKAEAIADEYGKFVIKGLCPGKYTLHISHVGCEPEYYELELRKDTSVLFFMHHTEEELEEVVVALHRKDYQVSVNIEKVQGKQLEKLRGLSLGETLKSMSGVSSLSTGTNISKPIIHGLQGNRIVIMNNGVRQEAQQWGNEHAPEIDVFLAQRISVIKGANTVRYGSDAIGGVIIMEPNALEDVKGFGGEANYVFHSNNIAHSANVMLEGNHSKIPALAWRVQGTFTRGGNARAPKYWLNNTGIQEGNFSAAIGWNKPNWGTEIFYSRFQTQIGILSSSHFGNLTDLLRAIEIGYPTQNADFTYKIGIPRQDVTHNLLKASSRVKTGKLGELKIVFAYQFNLRREFDKQRASNNAKTLNEKPGAEFGIQTITSDVIWEHISIRKFTGSIGASFMTQTNNQRYSSIMPSFWNFNGGIFCTERWHHKQLEIEAGVRLDYRWQQAYLQNERPIFSYVVPSGSVGMEYHFSEKIKLNVNVGSAWRAPNMVELFAEGVHHGAASYDKGNRNLKAEISANLSSTFDASWSWLDIRLGFYQNFIQQFIYIKPALQNIETIRGTFPVFEYTQANVSLTGGDIDVTFKPFKGFQIWSKTSLLRAWNRSDNEWLILMPPQRFENGLRYTFANLKHVGGLYLGVSVLNVFQQTLVPANQDFAAPPDGYWLLNAETGFEIKTQMPQPISINLIATNVLNTPYREYLNRFRYFSDAQGINVSLKLRVPLQFIKH